jgi:hypothetical protein
VILVLALRSLLSRPIRSAVLAGGFGLGVSVMAALLGIGGVILEQARTPALAGGGDVVIGGQTGRVGSAKFVLADVLGGGTLGTRVKVASPSTRGVLYLVDDRGATPVVVRGGIPSLERALGDPETSGVAGWIDTPADRDWASPDHEAILRAMDRFHPIPEVPARAHSWSEWLYFNGRAGSTRFYLTFLAGPYVAPAQRRLGVRLQLERNGAVRSYSFSTVVTDGQLAAAPDLTAGPNTVRLAGSEYRVHIDLAAESGGSRASGDIVVRARRGRSLPPFTMRGGGGWVSGYVVPVMSGALGGSLTVGAETIDLGGGTGYHDHNWGFWDGVRWRWGQVEGGGLAFVYGRVYPPEDAADASRLPGFLVALGEEGPVGYATDVTIDETDGAARAGPPALSEAPPSRRAQPRRIVVKGRSDSLTLTLDIDVDQTTTTRMPVGSFGGGMNFLQMRGTYHVSGEVGGRSIDFTAPGSAETFRQ